MLLSCVALAAPTKSVSDFLEDLGTGQVARVVINPNGQAQVTSATERTYDVQLLLEPSLYKALEAASSRYNTRYSIARPAPVGEYLSLGIQILAIVGIGALFFFLLRARSGGGGDGGVSAFTRSRAKQVEKPTTTFKEVAGCDEAKEELAEVVDFLKNPARYHDIGARIPKGVLLVGPPGSGKTLLAKAVAGEARVPFFTISGSDFVEMFVGVGAARVRDLFEQSRKAAPCIIFIDEIDAVGRKRGSGMGGGNDEREQTLNQLLVEMDGFETKHDIIILAATNRPDVLDAALLRPGRFDRQVVVDAPDVKGREEILRVHSRKKPLEENVDLKVVARRTPGFVGADLENLLNEAALLAARAGRRKVSLKDLDEAADRVSMGPARKSKQVVEADRRLVAYHEAGHAVTANLLPLSNKTHKLTIVPRGRAGGYMLPMPTETMHYSKARLLDEIATTLGGRVAEELFVGDVTTGAQNDFQQATNIARRMVAEWGMSERLGHVAHIVENEGFLGAGFETRQYSDATAKAIDAEVRGIIETQYARVKTLLESHHGAIERVVGGLFERETLTGEEVQLLIDGHRCPPRTSVRLNRRDPRVRNPNRAGSSRRSYRNRGEAW
ncbi:MAG: ATP-dependent zinc metalloprotease FtsH [Pleurocapsa sp. SU_196_0]|nr:ATP-dependent zinc metalloprotease FtsH [Pleurocapsa sp. SU_196_0]